MSTPPIKPKQAQLTAVIEAIRALDYDPLQIVPDTDDLLAEARVSLLTAYELLAGREWPADQRPPTEEQRVEWLELRCFEQRQLGLR